MKGYKGFEKGLICRGKQYAENAVFEEAEAKACESGMHFCENPFDVLDYYGFMSEDGVPNEFAEVEALDEPATDDGKKFASKKLRIGAKLGIPGFVKAFVDYTMSKVDFVNAKESNTGDRSAATNTGYRSAATNTGDRSAATNTGYRSAATNTGDQSAATNTGYQSAATNTGYRSAATNTGDQSAATNTGDRSVATNTGDRSVATNTGDQSAAIVEGMGSFAIAIGVEGRAKGKIGCYICVAEWKWNGYKYKLVDFQSRKVDGKTIKEDVFYKLVDGEFVAQEE